MVIIYRYLEMDPQVYESATRRDLAKRLKQLGGNPNRKDGKLKAHSTLKREVQQLEQRGGTRSRQQRQRRQRQQRGGDYAKLPPSATDKAAVWRAEVRDVQDELGVSYKEAMSIASERRKGADTSYKTMNERYVEHLDDVRQADRHYQPYGRKNKRPLSLEAAQRLLLQYYRQRANQYKNGPLPAMRKNIASCHKDPARTLTPGDPKSWKYRPGKYAKGPTGPGYYDMDGLDNLCGPNNKQARKESELYNMKFMHKKKKQTGGGGKCGTRTQSGGACRKLGQSQYGGRCHMHA
jgi:hypothetical protein